MYLPARPIPINPRVSLVRRASARISSMGTGDVAHVIINEIVIKSIFELHYGTLTGAPGELDADAAGRARGTEGLWMRRIWRSVDRIGRVNILVNGR